MDFYATFDYLIKMALKIGVSACLLGQKVRFDGKDKRSPYITDCLGRYLQLVPICPEIEIGMGVPREKVGLFEPSQSPRMLGLLSETDWTRQMTDYACRRVKQEDSSSLDGYVLQQNSPSCGLHGVKIFEEGGTVQSRAAGLYARVLQRCHPLLPIAEEAQLADSSVRENFIARIFAHHRLRRLWSGHYSRDSVIRFHASHKLLLLAHSPRHCRYLGKLVANIKAWKPRELRAEHSRLFMEAISVKSTISKNVNVLQHILGFLRDHLSDSERRYALDMLLAYSRNELPLIVPLALLRSHVDRHRIAYLVEQVYLHPDPDEIMLRNHT